MNQPEKYHLTEIQTNDEWLYLTGQISSSESNSVITNPHLHQLKEDQILLADVYIGWCGPCSAIESYLKRIRTNYITRPNSLVLAKVCCDEIQDLRAFKSDPRPTFLFWAKGGPVALMRGVNRPLLTRLVLQVLLI